MGLFKRRRDGERGAAAVEFALVLPILMLIVFGVIDFGFALNRYSAVSNAAREGVRAASLGAPAADIEKTVKLYLSDINGSTVNVTVTCKKPDNTNCSTYASDAASGGTAIVTVKFTQNWLTPVGNSLSSKMQITKMSQMRIE